MTPYYSDERVTIYHADFREHGAGLEADLVLADPPYQQTSLAWDRWPAGWPSIALQTAKPAGSLWCFGNLKMFWRYRDEFAGWQIAQDVIWEKHNGSGLHADRFRRVHEQPVHFYPARAAWADVYHKPQYTNDAKARRIHRKQKPAHYGGIGAGTYESRDGGPRLMRSVLHVRSMHGKALNPTQKPLGILSPLVRYSCPPGGLVVVPFCGSGSECEAALRAGCRVVAFDVRESECETAAQRVSQGMPALAGL